MQTAKSRSGTATHKLRVTPTAAILNICVLLARVDESQPYIDRLREAIELVHLDHRFL
jgi:hypothetical protein